MIGRGNFGSAWLVMHRLEGKKYIAKKVILEGLPPKEQEFAMLEVNLLKNLKHPNIVAYKESFLVPGMMIIIMEFCEGKSKLLISQWGISRFTLNEYSSKVRSLQNVKSLTG